MTPTATTPVGAAPALLELEPPAFEVLPAADPAAVVGAIVAPVVLAAAAAAVDTVPFVLPVGFADTPPVPAAPGRVVRPAETSSATISDSMETYLGAMEKMYACAAEGREVNQGGGEEMNAASKEERAVGLARTEYREEVGTPVSLWGVVLVGDACMYCNGEGRWSRGRVGIESRDLPQVCH